MPRQVEIAENATAAPEGKGIWRVCLIEADVEGSSGYYPAEVLKRDGPRVFAQGTHVFLDHATRMEEDERPEGSVKDLAAVLIEDAHFENGRDGSGLFARMQVFPDHKERVSAWAEHNAVGLSIRATGTYEIEESTGKRAITSLIHAQSVDIVTRAGAGGRLIVMTESARHSAGVGEQQLFATLSEADKKGMQMLFESVHTLTQKVDALQAELAEAKKDKPVEEPVGLTPGELFAKLSDSGLPSVLAKRVADEYTPGTDVDAKVAEYKALVDEVNSVGASEEPAETGEGTEDTQPTEPETAMAESKRNTGVGYVAESQNGSAFHNTLSELFGG